MQLPDDPRWVVAKFGGSSVASASRWAAIAGIVEDHVAAGRRVLVVCSALASVTDRLIAVDEARAAGHPVAPLLEVGLGAALLAVTRVVYGADGRA
ncbi:MAG: hypothetical protein K8M05_19815, partial [Deltaproteobacteria bacterium]|nr:hypothetical protein [Kofleriaceae bacterium]